MKKKRIMSFAMCTIFILSISIFLITAQAGELDDFNYTSEEKFVADYMCGLINPIGQSGVGSTYNYYSAQITHDYAFKNVAEELAKSKYQVWASIYWNKIDSFISADFKTAFGTRSYEEGIYEAILLDYISFQQDDAKIESEFKYQTFCIGYDSYGFIKDYIAVPFSDLQSAMGNPAISSPLTNHLKDYYKEVASSFEFDGSELALETSVNGVKTVYEFKKEYDQYMALCRGVHSRIECIRAMKIQAQQDGNTAFVNAADDVINKIELIMDDSMSATKMLSEISDNAAVRTIFKNMFFAPLVDKVIGADASSAIISTGVKVLDWCIGSNSVAQNNVKLLLMYTTETYAMLSAQDCKSTYVSNPTESNAAMLNSLYMYYIDFDQYATEFLRSYVESAIYGGAIHYSQTHVSDDDKQLYEDYMNQIEADIHFCSTLRSASNRQRDFFQSLVETKNSESTSSDVDNQNLESINWRNLNQSVTLNKDYAVYGDVMMSSNINHLTTLNLNGHTLKIYGNLIQSGGFIYIKGGRLEVWGDYRIQSYNTEKRIYEKSSGTLAMRDEKGYVLVCGSFVTQSTHQRKDYLCAGTMEVKGNFTAIGEEEIYKYNFISSGTHKVILSGKNRQNVSFEGYRFGNGFNELKVTNPNVYIKNGLTLNAISNDVILNSDIDEAYIYGDLDLQGYTLKLNGNFSKLVGNIIINGNIEINGNFTANGGLDFSGGNMEVSGDVTLYGDAYKKESFVNLNGQTLKINGNLIQSGGIMKISGGRLEVWGDYKIQRYNSTSKTYVGSFGTLQMANESDYVFVEGDFVTQSFFDMTTSVDGWGNVLNAGILEVKGDFTQKQYNFSIPCTNSTENFNASGKHKVILSGEKKQTVNFENYRYSGFNSFESKINSVEIVNGVRINDLLCDITFDTNGSAVIYGVFNTKGHSFVFNGDLEKECGSLSLSGGTAIINGNYTTTTNYGYYTTGDNTNLDGGILTINGNYTTDDNTNIDGGILTVNGEVIQSGGTTSISKGTFNVTSNYIQSDGIMNIDCGRLKVGGDYRIQEYDSTSKTYSDSYGILQMANDSDYVLVEGNFITQSTNCTVTSVDSWGNVLNAGILEVKGDFTQKKDSFDVDIEYNYTMNFDASGTHKVILSGDRKQTVNFESYSSSHFNNLELIRPRNVGYVFNPNPCWTGTLTAPDGDYELMRWDWDGYNSATAVFGYDTYELEKITANSDDMHSYEDSDGNIVHTATVLLNDKEYSDTKIEIKNTVDAKLAGHNLSLDGSIGVNFFMELGEDVASNENTYMHFELPNGSQSDVPITKAIIDTQTIPGKTLYVFKCEVAAKEMTDEISAQLIVPLTSENVSTPDIPTSETSGSEVLKGKRYTYTVKQYADYLFKNVDNNSDYRKAYDLIRAMVNYGVYAQEYFEHNTENPVTTDKLSMESVTAESLAQYAKNEKQGNDNVNFAGASLELLSETTLRMYFTINNAQNNAENVSFTYHGEKLQTQRTGTYYYVDLKGIQSDKLAEECIVTVTDGNDTFDVGFTPMAYCYNVISRATTPTRTEALKNLMRALVLYNQEAVKYFGK